MKLLTFIILSFHLYAIETTFDWRQVEPGNIKTGKCFEVDKETYGNKYQNIVNKEKCKTDDLVFVFNYLTGFCYEIDEGSEGKKYFAKVKTDLCKPEKTKFIFTEINKTSACYELDTETLGKNFYKKVKDDFCKESVKYLWEQKTETQGQCFKVGTLGGEMTKVKVRAKECRPYDAIPRFIRTSPFKGVCVEVHPKDPSLYLQKTQIDKCRPKNTLFIFYKKDDVSKGICYEVDEETRGDNFLTKVKITKCKEI